MTKILGIVPYSEMRDLLRSVAAQREDIELETVVGDYRDCIRILEENLNRNYEVILSRGGTAEELRKRIHYIPVVEIPVSAFDLIAAVRLARGSGARFAAVVFPRIAAEFARLKDLTQEDFPVFSVTSEEETRQVLQDLKDQGYGMVLTSAVAYEHAQDLGLPAIRITSGADCLAQALSQAVLLAGYYKKMHEELYFYKNILRTHERQTIILQEDGQILFTTEAYPLSEQLCEHSKKEIGLALKYGKCSYYKVLDGVSYSVDLDREELNGSSCLALKFTRTKIPVRIDRHGISYLDRAAVREDLDSVSLPTLLEEEELLRLKALGQSSSPVLITGEPNCYKSKIAKYLYLTGSGRTRPLILIDCAALDPAGWQFLMSHDNSPFQENGSHILIKNPGLLDPVRRTAFLNYMQTSRFCLRNRVCFVHTETQDPEILHFLSQLVQKTYCQVFEVPPLRERLARLDAYLSVFLNRRNQASGRQVLGLEPEARAALRAYAWPCNYKQLERVLEGLYDACPGSCITAAAVTAALHAEDLFSEETRAEASGKTFSPAGGSAAAAIDLSGSLEEITRQIALKVLDECGGNQRAAARRLQISRTTLWRMLKD